MSDPSTPVRETLTAIARSLPVSASMEDVQYLLYVRQQIESGLADDEANRVIDTEEMRRRLIEHKAKQHDSKR